MTTSNIPNALVRAAMEEGPAVDRDGRIAKLQKELERCQADIVEADRVERRSQLVQSAYRKLKRELAQTLTREERDAIDGSYLFLHAGCVDMVRHVPSNTDKGEHRKLERDLTMAEAMQEIKAGSETAG